MKKLIFLLCIIISLNISSGHAEAADQGIGVYPPIIKIKADPGADIKIPIRVKNLTNIPIEADISLRPFKVDDQGNTSLILHKDYTHDNSEILKNVSITEDNQSISNVIFSSQQEKILSLGILIPEVQKETDYYFSITYAIDSKGEATNTHSAVNIGTATNVLLSIGRSSSSKIESFNTSFLKGEGELTFSAEVKNNGVHFSTIHPKVTIENIFGKTIEIISLGEHNLLRQTSKSFVIETEKRYLLGPYKAYLSLGSKENIAKEATILVMPGKWVLGITALIFLSILTYLRVRRRIKHAR